MTGQPGDRGEEQGAICWCSSSCGQGQGQLVAPTVQAVEPLGLRWLCQGPDMPLDGVRQRDGPVTMPGC